MNVYVITHIPSGRKYVGKANDVARRWKQHTQPSNRKFGYLHAAITRYGLDQFELTNSFSFGSEADAFVAEALAIKALRTNEKGFGFNLDSGGKGGSTRPFSSEHKAALKNAAKSRPTASVETIRKRSLANTGRKNTIEARERMSVAARNRPRRGPPSEETRAKQSAAALGRTHTPQARANMSVAQKGLRKRPTSPETKEKMKTAQRLRRLREKSPACP